LSASFAGASLSRQDEAPGTAELPSGAKHHAEMLTSRLAKPGGVLKC
jgi:hypothetical protein